MYAEARGVWGHAPPGKFNAVRWLLRLFWGTIKPLLTDPPKSGQPLHNGRLACPQLILIHFKPACNFVLAKVRWELISVRCSELKSVCFSPETDSEDNADACRPLSLRHRCWIQRPSTIVALLRIVLAFLFSVKQRRGPKMRPHRVNDHRSPRLPEVTECL